MINKNYANIDQLTYDIINELGLIIGPDGLLYDQETRNIININGKNIKCTFDSVNNPVYVSDFNIVFDPINNIKLMTILFDMYLKNENEAGNFYCISYSIEEIEKKGPSYIRATLDNGNGMSFFEGKPYNNRCLSICDIILKFSGVDANLYMMDMR